MQTFVVLVAVLVAVSCNPIQPTAEELQQNQNAQYLFSSNVHDKISDLTQERHEHRNGLNVEGSYAYSDGYVRRIVKYVADEHGYRILSEEEIPLGEGPNVDPKGTASVDVYSHGNELKYAIKAIPSDEAHQLHFA